MTFFARIYRTVGKTLLTGLLLFAVSGCGAIEHRVLYRPDRYPHVWTEPEETELNRLCLEDVYFNSLDGTRLHGWFVQPSTVQPGNFIVFAHGRSGNVTTLKPKLFEFVRRYQVGVFVFDYRGFGKSDGYPSESGIFQDTLAARNWLATRVGMPPEGIIVMGRSLGAAAAVDVASTAGAKALIIESGFTSTSDVVRTHTKNMLDGKRFLRSCFDSVNKIGDYDGPILIGHGRYDKAFPISHARRLAESATSAKSVRLVEMDGGHTTPPTERYRKALGEFLNGLDQPETE